MVPDKSIIIALWPQATHGRGIFMNRWLPFIESLRELMKKTAEEIEESSDTMLLFNSRQLLNVINTTQKGFTELKKQYKWHSSNGPLPLKLLFDLDDPAGVSAFYNPDSPCWNQLQQESIYLTSRLYEKLADFVNSDDIPDYTLKDAGEGFFRLKPTSHSALDANLLFPYRDLPMRGQETECFYCAMTTHSPAHCPSKHITMRDRGLNRLGFLPFSKLNKIYHKVFMNLEEMSARLAEGISSSELINDDELLVLVAYLEIYRLYQPRFIDLIVFTLFSKWDTLEETEINVDSSNLRMALDCLRVGKLPEAEQLFENERNRKNGKHFGAAIGMAFISLEKERLIEMDHYLKKAASVAVMEKERFYCQLLLSRLYEIKGDYWAAREAVAGAEKILPFREELQIRKLQLAARSGFNEKNMKKLRVLMVDWKEMFMTILIDPHLLPVQGAVEVFAVEILNNIGQEAKNSLLNLKGEFEQLQEWLGHDDQQIKETKELLISLKNKFQKQSYYDLLEVADRSASLALTCKNIRLEELRKLKAKLKKIERNWDDYSFLWKSYKFKSFFKEFGLKLTDCKKKLIKINKLTKKEGKKDSVRQEISLINAAEIEIKELRKIHQKMILLMNVINSCKIFSLYLMFSEITLVLASVTLFFLTRYLGTHPGLGRLAELGVCGSTSCQYRAILIIIFVVAPSIATLLTIKKLAGKK